MCPIPPPTGASTPPTQSLHRIKRAAFTIGHAKISNSQLTAARDRNYMTLDQTEYSETRSMRVETSLPAFGGDPILITSRLPIWRLSVAYPTCQITSRDEYNTYNYVRLAGRLLRKISLPLAILLREPPPPRASGHGGVARMPDVSDGQEFGDEHPGTLSIERQMPWPRRSEG
jgi:hypothetical protein